MPALESRRTALCAALAGRIQRIARGRKARRHFLAARAAVLRMQTAARTAAAKRAAAVRRSGATRIGKMARGRLARRLCLSLRRASITGSTRNRAGRCHVAGATCTRPAQPPSAVYRPAL